MLSKLSSTSTMSIFRKLIAITAIAIAPATASALFMYETTTTFTRGGAPSSDTLIMNWSTNKLTGVVVAGDLVDWRLSLFDGSTLLFSDTAVSDGVVQSIGGASRSLGDLRFRFDLDAFGLDPAAGLTSFDNDYPQSQRSASGLTYNLFSDGSNFVSRIRYQDGTRADNAVAGSFSHNTTTAAAVPVPATLLLMGLGLAGLGWSRCKKA